jgi:hypothetical protein
MERWTTRCGFALVTIATFVVALGVLSPPPALPADHRDAPAIALDQPGDINDVYVFVANGQVVLALAVNPLTAAGTRAFFAPDVLYQFKIDNNGDFIEDLVIQASFSAPGGINVDQTMTLRGPARPRMTGAATVPLTAAPAGVVPVRNADGIDTTTFVPTALGGSILQAWAGMTDDPFFYDEVFVERQFAISPGGGLTRAPGRDFHGSFNVSTIAVAVAPSLLIGSGRPPLGGGTRNPNLISVWATTSRARTGGRRRTFAQIDRAAKPGINDFLIGQTNTAAGPVPNPTTRLERKTLLNRSVPSQDLGLFSTEVRDELIQRYGNSTTAANGKLPFFLPDVLVLDTTSTAGFPNGRRPGDDGVDLMLQAMTGLPAAADGVKGNDQPFESTFPFFGLQHTPDEDPGPRG